MRYPSPQPNLAPTEKITYGGLSALGTVAAIALAKWRGYDLDPTLASACSAGVFFLVGYFTRNKYHVILSQIDVVADILANRYPQLNARPVKEELKDSQKLAELIAAPDAIAQLSKTQRRP